MSDPSKRERLLSCFQAVFPAAPLDSLTQATIDSRPDWDSVAHVTLISVVEEEFGTVMPAELYEELTSFNAFLNAVDGLGS